MKALFTSASVEWATPQDFFDSLDKEFKFTLDVAANIKNRKCRRFFNSKQDALKQDWKGERCWMNPPYGRRIAEFIKKAHESNALVVGLLPARTDTKAFHDHIYGKAEIRFVKGRLKFSGAKHSAPFPNMVVIWRPKSPTHRATKRGKGKKP